MEFSYKYCKNYFLLPHPSIITFCDIFSKYSIQYTHNTYVTSKLLCTVHNFLSILHIYSHHTNIYKEFQKINPFILKSSHKTPTVQDAFQLTSQQLQYRTNILEMHYANCCLFLFSVVISFF